MHSPEDMPAPTMTASYLALYPRIPACSLSVFKYSALFRYKDKPIVEFNAYHITTSHPKLVMAVKMRPLAIPLHHFGSPS